MKPANDQTAARASGAFFLPVVTVTESNTCGHWRVRARRARQQKSAMALALTQVDKPVIPCCVTITRVGRGVMDDDNLPTASKHLRDQIATWLGVDDRHRNIVRYAYEQERGSVAGVRISFAPMAVTPASLEAFRAATAKPARAKKARSTK